MELNMKEIGKIIKQMVMENFGMLMETILKVNGRMIKLTEKELIFILMGQNILVIGLMIFRKDLD
jgi:hypothetical protein